MMIFAAESHDEGRGAQNEERGMRNEEGGAWRPAADDTNRSVKPDKTGLLPAGGAEDGQIRSSADAPGDFCTLTAGKFTIPN